MLRNSREIIFQPTPRADFLVDPALVADVRSWFLTHFCALSASLRLVCTKFEHILSRCGSPVFRTNLRLLTALRSMAELCANSDIRKKGTWTWITSRLAGSFAQHAKGGGLASRRWPTQWGCPELR